MSDLLKRISDYFTNDYKGDDKTAPTMEITVCDMRYIASMNVDRCRAESELRNIKQGDVSDDVCEWKKSEEYPFDWMVGCDGCEVHHRQGDYCPRCGKKILCKE